MHTSASFSLNFHCATSDVQNLLNPGVDTLTDLVQHVILRTRIFIYQHHNWDSDFISFRVFHFFSFSVFIDCVIFLICGCFGEINDDDDDDDKDNVYAITDECNSYVFYAVCRPRWIS